MRYLFYILPAIVNIIGGLFFFISAKRMADTGASSFMVALTMAVWAAFYAGTSYLQGYILTRRNATRLLLIGQTVLLVSLCGLLLTENVNLQYFWLMGTGIGTSMFFTPFQMVVKLLGKEEHSLDSISMNTAIYTFSWSFGLALGPFLTALIWGCFSAQNGWQYCYGITIAMVIAVIISILFLSHFVKQKLAEEETTEKSADNIPDPAIKTDSSTSGLPDLMVLVWILEFAGYTAVTMMRTYIPDHCTKVVGLTISEQGMVVGMVSLAQALTALCCWKSRRWPYRPGAVGVTGTGAIAAFALYAFCPAFGTYLLAALLLGIFSGIFCFMITFHALVNPSKTAKYVSVNETIVGATSMTAPLFGGLLADWTNAIFPFYFCGIMLLVMILLYVSRTWKYRKI
ncbi:MAG: MFS transporter [Lentisphaeria bacterium]|nr:MFS transporter [Lentisphaeria bacterium]